GRQPLLDPGADRLPDAALPPPDDRLQGLSLLRAGCLVEVETGDVDPAEEVPRQLEGDDCVGPAQGEAVGGAIANGECDCGRTPALVRLSRPERARADLPATATAEPLTGHVPCHRRYLPSPVTARRDEFLAPDRAPLDPHGGERPLLRVPQV